MHTAPELSSAESIRSPQSAPLLSLASRAAQYVRMSTDHQQYSIANQKEAIAAYAQARGLEIVRTFVDAGRSGLRIQNRTGLLELLGEVTGGRASFRTVLVYDVSRWGRFQDSDESACYEFLCRRAGVNVVYCTEQFPNDCSPMSTVLKGLKRVMAAEFSRELSRKVHAAQCRMVRLGFCQGGTVTYGLRRLVVDKDGKPRGFLERGQRKFVHTDRVVVVPGPQKERRVVRWIFSQVARSRRGPHWLADELNRRGVPHPGSGTWAANRIRTMLDNEQYAGNLVFNRTSATLGAKRVRNPREQWARADGTVQPIVSVAVFRRAQAVVASWATPMAEEAMLDALKALLKRKGRLSVRLIQVTRGMPSDHLYRMRFGSMVNAYRRIGYEPRGDWRFQENRPAKVALLREVRQAVLDGVRRRGYDAEFESRVLIRIGSIGRLAVVLGVKRLRRGHPAWRMQHQQAVRPDLILGVRIRGGQAELLDYCLVRGGSRCVFLMESRQSPLIVAISTKLDEVLDRLTHLSVAAESAATAV